MIQWFHNFIPQPILFQWGWLSLYWYGFIMAIAILIGFVITTRLARREGYSEKQWYDMLFYSLIASLVGARLYHVFLELPYYISHPLEVLQVWHGGLAIHGAIIGAILIVYFYTKKNKCQFAQTLDILVIALIFGQALGRWGNFFNQELFGLPTDLPWGIFIDVMNRPEAFISYTYFHPTFLYESVLSLLLLMGLLVVYKYKKRIVGLVATIYLLGYSMIRFWLEFIRIDKTPELWGLRWPQWASLLIVFLVIIYWVLPKLKKSV
jgi:phosphatidylglycerol---prolipoprotein diacylglyceryl transferase